MATITIPKSITGREELIVIPKKDFKAIKSQITSKRMKVKISLPQKNSGLSEKRAFKILKDGIEEYKRGKTHQLKSLRELRYGN